MLRPYISQPRSDRRSFLDLHRQRGARMRKLSCLLLTATLLVPIPALAQSDVVSPSDNLVTDGLPPVPAAIAAAARPYRSEEHTSELQSPCNLVCRLLLEKKKKQPATH